MLFIFRFEYVCQSTSWDISKIGQVLIASKQLHQLDGAWVIRCKECCRLIVFPITLLTGFWLNKYVTFRNSTLHGVRQLIRYILIVLLNLLINYIGLKLLVDILGWYPTPSKMCITLVTILFSYLGQRYYSFRH